MARGRDRLAVQQRERVEEAAPVRDQVGLPVVEPPIADPHGVTRDREQVERPQRDSTRRDDRDHGREAPGPSEHWLQDIAR